MTNDPPRTPAHLLENHADLLQPANPRVVVGTQRRWMEPYHALDEIELRARLTATREHRTGFVLWLRELSLFSTAFNRGYDFSSEPNRELIASYMFRLELLGLAGTNFKLTLDALLAGYYSACMALERHMLETWRRVAYARLSTWDIWRWYPQQMWPADVKPTPEGQVAGIEGTMPTKIPSAKQIANVIEQMGTDRDKAYLPTVSQGFDLLNDHAHPTLEGTTQTWDPDNPNRNVFGPTFSDLHCRRCLTRGLTTGMMLLEETALIDPLGDDWFAELVEVQKQIGPWLIEHQF